MIVCGISGEKLMRIAFCIAQVHVIEAIKFDISCNFRGDERLRVFIGENEIFCIIKMNELSFSFIDRTTFVR